jgi:hypothetical protein
MRSCWCVVGIVVAFAAACGDNTATPADSNIDDAAPDATLMGEIEVTTSNGSPATAPSFGLAKTGVTSQMTVTLTNGANGPSGTIAIALTGAPELALDLAASTCDGANLAANEACSIVIAFAPTADGSFEGSLSVTSDLGVFTLPITAMSGSSDVMLSPLTATLGHVEIGVPTASFTLMNIGTVDASIGTVNVTGTGLAYDSTTCAASLAPSASCTISFRTTDRGDLSGSVSAIVDGESLSATFTARGAYRVTIDPTAGTGTGVVTTYMGSIDPITYTTPLVNCPPTCSVLASAPMAFRLTANVGSTNPVRGALNYTGPFNTWAELAPTGPTTIEIPFRAYSSSLRFFGSPIDFGLRQTGVTFSSTIELQNIGAAAVSFVAIEPFFNSQVTIASSTCGTSLGPGTNCFVQLSVTPSQGPFSDLVTVPVEENGNAYVAQAVVSGIAARRVTVNRSGPGTGRVTSTPAGIDCPFACNTLVSTSSTMTLNAVPDPGMAFDSWANCPSAAGPVCTLGASVTNQTVSAIFEVAGTSQVEIVQVGSGFGQVQVENEGTETLCNGSCTVEVVPGTSVSIETRTVSQFDGYTGACVTTGVTCSFTAAAGSNVVNIGIAKRPKEAWVSLLPGTTIYTAAFDGSGNVLVSTPTELRKISPTGISLWTKPIITSAIATGPGDIIAVMTSTSVLLLDSQGNTTWSQPGPGSCHPERCLAIDSDGTVAARSSGTLMRISPSGSITFSISFGSTLDGVGFSGNNVIAPGGFNGKIHAYAFDATGTALGPSALPIGERINDGMMSSTPTTVMTVSAFNKIVYVGLTPSYSTQITLENQPRIAANDTDRIVAYRNDQGGWAVAGPLGVMDRPFSEVADIAISSANRTAIVGRWGAFTGNQAFVQVFDP